MPAQRVSKAFKDASAMISWTNNEYGDVFIDWTKVPDDVKDAITNDMHHYLKQGMALMETGQVPGREGFDQESALRNFEQMIIGGPFNTMEAISRMTAYIAAYRVAQDPKVREKFYDLYSANQIVQGAINDNDGVNNKFFSLCLIGLSINIPVIGKNRCFVFVEKNIIQNFSC